MFLQEDIMVDPTFLPVEFIADFNDGAVEGSSIFRVVRMSSFFTTLHSRLLSVPFLFCRSAGNLTDKLVQLQMHQ